MIQDIYQKKKTLKANENFSSYQLHNQHGPQAMLWSSDQIFEQRYYELQMEKITVIRMNTKTNKNLNFSEKYTTLIHYA